MTRAEVAAARGVSVDAVKYHLASIGDKLGVRGVAALRHWPGIPAASPLHTVRGGPSMTDPTALTAVGQIALLVTDVEVTERFYRDTLGLRHLYTFGELTFFDCGGTRLFLRAVPAAEWTAGSIVYFRVGDIHATVDRIVAAGAELRGAPHVIHTHADGTEEWMAFFTDPAGNMLALMCQAAPGAD